MLPNQIQKLNETGLGLLSKAALCTQTKDALSFTELGLKCLAEARSILEQHRRNSVLLFAECCLHISRKPECYPAYLEFCTRNDLTIVSELDFKSVIGEVALTPDEAVATPSHPLELNTG